MRFFDGYGYGADPSGNAAGGGVPGDPGGDNGASGDGATEPQSAIELPAGVTSTPAGARLAALLESVPVEQVAGFDTVEYMKAAHRLANHYQGMFLKALLETGLRLPAPDDQVARADSPGEFASEEARAALVWSRSRADGALSRAYQMFGQTPAVGNALVDAAIDEPRANAFINWTSGLSDEHTARVVDELLPAAHKWTISELIDRIKKLAIALDPEWAERRYRESLKERRVELRQTQFGTADLAGRDLPVDRAKASADRIHALATSCKAAGDKRRIDVIRADLYLGMLDGLFQQMTDQQIVDHVLAHPVSDDLADDQDSDNTRGLPDDGGPRDGGDDPGHGGGDNSGGGAGSNAHAERGDSPSDSGTADRANPIAGESSAGDHADADHTGSSAGGAGGVVAESPARFPARSEWNVHELRAELTTLLGLDEHPAELPGVGYVPASVARAHAARMAAGEWRFVICTDEGVPICSGITPRRPTTFAAAGRDTKRGGILELQLTATTLADLKAGVEKGKHAVWAALISDINGRYHLRIVDNTPSGEGQAHGTTEAADARRRGARAGLRRWVEVRDRYCLHPPCRMPATQTDQDHRIDYANGGLTVEENLDSECRHDHRLQHDGGWTVHRPPGSDRLTGPIIWTSPLGHQYESRPPPVMYPYPEPGNHYPAHDTLPEWFKNLVEQVRSARRAGAKGSESNGANSAACEVGMSRAATPTPDVPPF